MKSIASTLDASRAGLGNDDKAADPTPASVLAFADFTFDVRRQELLDANGASIALRPKPMALLRHMLAHPQQVLDKKALLETLWPGVVVTDDSLVQCVGELRAALGDRSQHLIRTLPRRGYRFEAFVESLPSGRTSGCQARPTALPVRSFTWPSRKLLMRYALAGAMLVTGAVGATWHQRTQVLAPMNIDQAMAASRATAVLTFFDAGVAGGKSALGNELADATVVHVSQRARASVAVLGRASTSDYDPATPDIARMGRELKAFFVIGGRITRHGGRVQIVTHATSVESGRVMVLDQSEFGSDDEALHSKLTERIASSMRMRYLDFEAERFARPGFTPDAMELTRAAWRDINTFMNRDDLLRARARLEKASAADSRSVMVAQGLAVTYGLEYRSLMSPNPKRDLALSEQHNRRAIELLPGLQENLSAWCEVLTWRGRPDAAESLARQLLDANPNYATARLVLANALNRQGRADEALAQVERTRNLSAADSRLLRVIHERMLDAALIQGDEAGARAIARQWVSSYPTTGWPWAVLAALELRAGRRAEAVDAFATARHLLPHATIDYVSRLRIGTSPIWHGATDRLLIEFRQLGMPES